ncbi:MAG: TylF/MycF/NovP-related O-methyltransferase [Nanoarchaeota archaeon]
MNKIPKIVRIPARIVREIIKKGISVENGVMTFYNGSEDRINAFKLINQIKKEIGTTLDDDEMYQIYSITKRTEKIKGDIAEVGVYKGASGRVICEMKGNRSLYLFDTFEGLPGASEEKHFEKGDFSAPLDKVKRYLGKFPNVYFYRGIFPATSEPIVNKKFSFVHLDADLYESTLECLKFFYPRMSKGGIIISHDYVNSIGVTKAFAEFFGDKPEVFIELCASQVLVVKL